MHLYARFQYVYARDLYRSNKLGKLPTVPTVLRVEGTSRPGCRRKNLTRRLCFTVRTSRRPPVHRPNQTKSVSRVVAVGERIAVWSSLMST